MAEKDFPLLVTKQQHKLSSVLFRVFEIEGLKCLEKVPELLKMVPLHIVKEINEWSPLIPIMDCESQNL